MKKTCTLCAVLLCTLGLAAVAHANLITNGSFEEPEVTSDNNWTLVNNADIPGWTSVRYGQIELQEVGLYSNPDDEAADGSQWAELDSLGSDLIFQSVNTTIGTEYILTFAFAARPDTGIADNQLGWGVTSGQSYYFTEVADGSNETLPQWEYYEFVFTAQSANTLIIFEDLGTDNALGTLLDDVTLKVVPIPGTLALLLSGIVGLVAVRRRKRG